MKTIKKWQEPLYGIGGFGPGFMYQVVLTYLLYFYRPALARVEAGALIFAPAAAYALGMFIARALDGLVDLPIASWTDNLKSRWGRRRPMMVIGLVADRDPTPRDRHVPQAVERFVHVPHGDADGKVT